MTVTHHLLDIPICTKCTLLEWKKSCLLSLASQDSMVTAKGLASDRYRLRQIAL